MMEKWKDRFDFLEAQFLDGDDTVIDELLTLAYLLENVC
jgi:hypothetical protein